MPNLSITFVHPGYPAPWADVEELALVDADRPDWQVAILEAGMTSGAPSIGLRLELDDGRTLIAETSLALWSSVTIAARARFPEAFEGGPLDPTI